MANQLPAPPYTPGFGRRPPVVAGRDDLVDDMARVLEAGPEHPRFCRALLGSRGTGKTILLDVFGEVAAKELGWAVLHVQALQEESLVAVLLQRIPESVRPWERFGRGSKELQAQLSVAVNSARATVERGHNAGTGGAAAAFEDALGGVGSFATRHGTGLLLTVDEAQMAPQEDLSARSTRPPDGGSPSAPTRGHHFRRAPDLQGAPGRRRTYASRLPVEELANLEPSAARLALVEPAAHRHVAWEDDALGLLVRRSGGHPYYVQLFGWHAWEAAQGEATITLAHAKAGLKSARAELAGQYEATWPPPAPRARLPGRRGRPGRPGQRRCRRSGQDARQRTETARRGPRPARAHARAIGSTRTAQVRFVDAEMAEWVAERADGTLTTTAVQRGPDPRPAGVGACPAGRRPRTHSSPSEVGGAPSGPGVPGADATGLRDRSPMGGSSLAGLLVTYAVSPV